MLKTHARSTPVRFAVPLALSVIIWFLPRPPAVSAEAWHLLAIFVGTIVAIVLEPMPMGAVAVCGITAVTLTHTLPLSDALSGFSHPVIWLVVMAFFISRGFIKTGLGSRIAYTFMRLLGRRTLGLAYSMLATDLVLAPAIPSITARAGAVIYPIARSVAEAFGSRPGDGSERRIGSFLILNSFFGVLVTRRPDRGRRTAGERVSDRLLRLPFYNDLSEADQQRVIDEPSQQVVPALVALHPGLEVAIRQASVELIVKSPDRTSHTGEVEIK